jgi:hypothetical protein
MTNCLTSRQASAGSSLVSQILKSCSKATASGQGQRPIPSQVGQPSARIRGKRDIANIQHAQIGVHGVHMKLELRNAR